MQRLRASASHAALALAEASLIALLVVGLVAGSALAAPGGKGGGKGKPGGGNNGSSSLTLVMVVDQNGNGSPNWNDTITFDVQTNQTSTPYVEVTCYQNGTLVYSAWAGFYPDYPWPESQRMTLRSPSWTGGAADCKAVLNTNLATLNFHVAA